MSVSLLAASVLLGCHEDPPIERHYPMRAPVHANAPPAVETASQASEPSLAATDDEPSKLHERPKADPAIDAALELINDSGLRFIDQADGPDDRPSEYTAQQFASMLRSKWDWIGYDIVELDTWLAEIATRSFKSNLPYLVVEQDGTQIELRAWLDARLREAAHARSNPP